MEVTEAAFSVIQKRGVLSAKGSLKIDTKKKLQPFHFCVGNGLLWYYSKDYNFASTESPIEIITLTNAELADNKPSSKSEKEEQFSFCLNNSNDKKFSIIIGCQDEAEKTAWMEVLQDNIDSTNSKVFETTVQDAAMKTNGYVPPFIRAIAQCLEKHFTVEGIFRLSGNATTIQEYREQLNRGEFIDVTAITDTHLLTGIMKTWFRELANPLLTFERYAEFLKFGGAESGNLAGLKALLQQLPTANRVLLSWLMKFLKRVSEFGAQSKMEISNLAIVFGPTILRQPTTKAASKDELSATSATNKLCEILIINHAQLFDVADEALFEAPSRPPRPNTLPVNMPEFTAEEKVLADPVLAQHKEDVHNPHAFRVFRREQRSKTIDETEGSLVIGQNRIYFFAKGGKLDVEFHYLDMLELHSTNQSEFKILYGAATKPQELIIRSVSYTSWDIDIILRQIIAQYELNFVGTPPEAKYRANIIPKIRDAEIRSSIATFDPYKGCAGYVRTYATYCDYLGIPVTEEIAWDLDNLFYNNDVKTFNLSEFAKKDRYPNDDFKALMLALQHNVWFTELICDGQKIGGELTLVANVMKTNKSIRVLRLASVGATNTAVEKLAESFKANTNLGLDVFSICDNALEDKSLIALASAFEKFTFLGHLNISNCQVKTKGMLALMEALQKNTAICGSLHTLNIAGNSLDNEGSRKLGLFLGKATALHSLNISATQPNFQFLCTTFEKSTSIQTCNISDLKVPKQTEEFVVHFLKLLPAVTDLQMRNVGIGVKELIDILTGHPNLIKLDISDNDWSDDALIALGEHFAPFQQPERSPALEELTMNRMFARRTKNRSQAINSLISILELRPIRALRVQGGGNSKLKGDLSALVFGLINNKTLQELDISGNQSGEPVAVALCKLLQHNKSLHTLYWDDNMTLINGLRLFKIGLDRNDTLRKMPLPLLDMSEMLKSDQDRVALVALSNEIQAKVFDNAEKFNINAVAELDSKEETPEAIAIRKASKSAKRKSERKMTERVSPVVDLTKSAGSPDSSSPLALRKGTSTRSLKGNTSSGNLATSKETPPPRPNTPAPLSLPASLAPSESSPPVSDRTPSPRISDASTSSKRRADIDKATLTRASLIFGGAPNLDGFEETTPQSPARKATLAHPK